MKKNVITILLAVTMILSVFTVTAFAEVNTASNDKFIAQIPENFEIVKNGGYDHYYYSDNVNYSGDIEIFVEGNFLFSDGIEATADEVIDKRITDFLCRETMYTNLTNKKISKTTINGLTVCRFLADNDSTKNCGYIYTTKENLFVVLYTSYDDNYEPESFKTFIDNFYINGTHYNGEKLSKNIDFSKEIHYIDALERDVLTAEYYDYYANSDSLAGVFLIIIFLAPIAIIVLIVLLFVTKKKLNEYKNFFGDINTAKSMMNTGYMPYQNNGQYFGNYAQSYIPNNPYNGQYFPNQYPQQYAQQTPPQENQSQQNSQNN